MSKPNKIQVSRYYKKPLSGDKWRRIFMDQSAISLRKVIMVRFFLYPSPS
jgi:hypothetical protein